MGRQTFSIRNRGRGAGVAPRTLGQDRGDGLNNQARDQPAPSAWERHRLVDEGTV
ncbi:MAG: hypothetical protein ACKOFW_07080 [Planctomycetaceae bacterium]